jgi:hypothetical protein
LLICCNDNNLCVQLVCENVFYFIFSQESLSSPLCLFFVQSWCVAVQLVCFFLFVWVTSLCEWPRVTAKLCKALQRFVKLCKDLQRFAKLWRRNIQDLVDPTYVGRYHSPTQKKCLVCSYAVPTSKLCKALQSFANLCKSLQSFTNLCKALQSL